MKRRDFLKKSGLVSTGILASTSAIAAINNKIGVIGTFTCLSSNALGDYQIRVHGSKGTIQLDYTKAWIYYEKGFEKELADVDGVSGATKNPHLQGNGNLWIQQSRL